MIARVTTFRLKLERLQPVAPSWRGLQHSSRGQGGRGCYVLVDPETGDALNIGLFESREAVEAHNQALYGMAGRFSAAAMLG